MSDNRNNERMLDASEASLEANYVDSQNLDSISDTEENVEEYESLLEEVSREIEEGGDDIDTLVGGSEDNDTNPESSDIISARESCEETMPQSSDLDVTDNVEELTADSMSESSDSDVTENVEEPVAAPESNPQIKKVNSRKPLIATEKMVGIGIFSALAFVVSLFVRFPVQFLTFDAKDAVITISAFVYGPLAAVIISLIVAFIEMITVSTTMWYGFLMNFASSAIFSVTASLIYRKKRNLNGAIIGLYSAIAATVGVMLLLNVFITPLYFGLPVADPSILAMLPTLLLPFNFAKALMNSAIVMIIYKPVVTALKRLGIVKTQGGSAAMTFNRTTKIILALGAVGLATSIAIFLLLVL